MRAALTLAKNVCDGRKKFAVLETQRRAEVADVRRIKEHQGRNYKELQSSIEYMEKRRSVGYEMVSGSQSFKAQVWCLGERRVDVDWKGSLGDQSAMSSAGGSQKKRKAAVQEESVTKGVLTSVKSQEVKHLVSQFSSQGFA